MESNGPLGSIIGFDAEALGAVNRGRRSTDPGNATFAEVYDLAAYARSGSRTEARVDVTPAPLAVASATAAPMATPLTVHSSSLEPVDRAAADRLYLHLTTGGSWLRVTDDHSGTVVMRLHDSAGTPVRELSITELASDGNGPEVA